MHEPTRQLVAWWLSVEGVLRLSVVIRRCFVEGRVAKNRYQSLLLRGRQTVYCFQAGGNFVISAAASWKAVDHLRSLMALVLARSSASCRDRPGSRNRSHAGKSASVSGCVVRGGRVVEGRGPFSSRAPRQRRRWEQFNIRAFHDAVLELGSVPLPVLESRIDRFIAGGREGALS